MGLFDIPQELRIQVLSHLDAISLTRCAFTCKSLYETFRTTSQLEYIIQLYFEGLTDARVSTDYAQLIQHLQRRRKAWTSPKTIEHAEPFALNTHHVCKAYELVGGAFAHANRKYFEIVWLPTASNPEAHTLRRASESTGMTIRDFAMDPTQDVIALLEDSLGPLTAAEPRIVRVHIRTISTDTIHPCARHSFLQLSVAPKPNFGIAPLQRIFMQFARDTLVLYFYTRLRVQPYIHIWDWTTGEVLSDCSRIFDPSIPREYEFGLLDSIYCFVTSTTSDSGEIRLYKLLRSPATLAAVPLATLYLPPTASDTDIINIDAHAAPIEAHPLRGALVTQEDEDRLHVFTVHYMSLPRDYDEHIYTSLNMFVHQRVFMKYCKRWEGGAPLQIPWEEWGPANTRLICPAWVQQEHWMRYVHGQRVVCPETIRDVYSGDNEDPSTVKVLDFSLAAVLSAQQQQQRPPTSPSVDTTRHPGCLLRTSTIPALEDGLFEEDVETHLPCVVTEWAVRREYSAYMIHADGIVGVHINRDESRLLHAYPI